MIEKRLVQWYAADAGVDLDIAEREVILAYVLRILSDQGLLDHLAFKGGTAIRKLFLGHTGRFSLDLDFSAVGHSDPEDLVLDLVGVLHKATFHEITFSIPGPDYYATGDSCGAEVSYQHDWVSTGRFGFQVSFRASPLLPVRPIPLRHERYFEWMEIAPPEVPALHLHEVIGEKIRAAIQRTRVRDLYDLYLLGHQPFDRAQVRRIATIKCWETRYAWDPDDFLTGLSGGRYDWVDLARLVRRDHLAAPAEIVAGVRGAYAFLLDLTEEEARLAADPYGRESETYRMLADSLKE
jgi:predicted nucleotidyltransferase component of viral defense system